MELLKNTIIPALSASLHVVSCKGEEGDDMDSPVPVSQEDLKRFLRQPPYIIISVLFIVIFVLMWFVSDLPPHDSKKGKK